MHDMWIFSNLFVQFNVCSKILVKISLNKYKNTIIKSFKINIKVVYNFFTGAFSFKKFHLVKYQQTIRISTLDALTSN